MKTGSYRFRKQKSREVLLSAFAILSCSDDISDVFLFLSCSAFPCRLHCWASWPPSSGRNSHQLLSFYIPPAERESLFFEGFSLVLRLMGIDSDGLKPPLLASATWVRRCSGTYPGPLTYLSHPNHTGRKGQGCFGGKSRQVSAPTLHRSFLRCGTFCMRCYLWTIQPSVRVWCSHLGTSHFHSCSTAVFKDVPSLLFWSPRRKKEFFCSYRIFLWLLKMYHFLLSYCIPPSLICFPKPLALVALSTNNKIQRCDTLPPPRLLPSIWPPGQRESQTVFAAPFSFLAVSEHHLLVRPHEVGSLSCWTAPDFPCACTLNTPAFMHTDTDGARDSGHCGFAGGSRWWLVSARLFNRSVGLEPAKLRTQARAFHLPWARSIYPTN